ncbi:Sec-independent protein translocase TatB [Microbacterium sp. LRZ72]|uniref:Sec-independent protein translocase TatB n=1 Tax=Microbacterium sp. LRZ72 TaxID=2942481 RepID=UPI0029A168E4|nr:Sec-independent protein translocase TatB [Microbacterium sp. LRZ72]MDX2375754.1 Sec-independent protein translocase TatB [Microbacterium sp. LRZ72]
MFFGLTFEKLLLIGVLAALLVGPERLPRYAESLAHLTVRVKDFLQGAKTRVRDEMGPEFDDVDWQKLDPRQYDPRRIIREALLDDATVPQMNPGPQVKPVSADPAAALAASRAASGETAVEGRKASVREPGAPPPFDSEAT